MQKYGARNFTVTSLGSVLCSCKEEVGEIENRVYELLRPTMNTYKSYTGLSPSYNKRYRNDNREEIKKQRHNYYLENKHEILRNLAIIIPPQTNPTIGMYGME